MPIAKKIEKKELKEVMPLGYIKARNGEIITYVEYDKRCAEWDEYYPKVRNKPTRAYSRYLVMKEAFLQNRMDVVKELTVDARKQLEEQDWELVKPNLPDPRFID